MKTIFLILYLFVICSNGYCDKVNNDNIAIDNTVDDIAAVSGIDQRVLWIHNNLDGFTCEKNGIYDDYFYGKFRVKRAFFVGDDAPVENDSTASFDLFYDKSGNLIYAYIIHYRSAQYGIYFQNNELLYVKVGPFHMGDPFLEGNLEQAKAFISTHEQYSFVLDDINICMNNAYK